MVKAIKIHKWEIANNLKCKDYHEQYNILRNDKIGICIYISISNIRWFIYVLYIISNDKRKCNQEYTKFLMLKLKLVLPD